MAAVHADTAAFGYAVYSQGVENILQPDERHKEENDMKLLEQCSCSKEDFIVFAEFSEVTGPVPLLIIPPKLVSYEDIDMNALIMKIMSADYQACPSGQLAVSSDVQLLQHEVLPGRAAYVHYCALHDLRARGFVRPLCLAYVSADRRKLHARFAGLRRAFLHAAEILKYNNRETFTKEISAILANLKQVQNRYFSWKKREQDGERLSAEERGAMARTRLDQLAQQRTELHHMQLAAEAALQRARGGAEAELRAWRGALQRSRRDQCRRFLARADGGGGQAAQQGQREPLRCVPALGPHGAAAMLWRLLALLRRQRACRLHTPLHMFPPAPAPAPPPPHPVISSPEEALADDEYLQLLLSASVPFQWPNLNTSPASCTRTSPIDVLLTENMEYVETNLVASGNEASSSYHSAPESLSELMVAVRPEEEAVPSKRSVSVESFLDVLSDSDSCDEPLPEEDDGYVLEIWSCCPWNSDSPAGTSVAGRRLLRFFQQYPRAAQHIVHSLLTGRTVVLAAGEPLRTKVQAALIALSALVPLFPLPVMWWHRGILVSSHVASYRLIGICVPERLSVHDMLSPRDKNLVTILEMSNGRLWGPAYSGQLLNALETMPAAIPSDQTLLFLLRTVADSLREKLFVLKTSSAPVAETLSRMGLKGCDAAILKHLLQLEGDARSIF